jgi:hypothetical protein
VSLPQHVGRALITGKLRTLPLSALVLRTDDSAGPAHARIDASLHAAAVARSSAANCSPEDVVKVALRWRASLEVGTGLLGPAAARRRGRDSLSLRASSARATAATDCGGSGLGWGLGGAWVGPGWDLTGAGRARQSRSRPPPFPAPSRLCAAVYYFTLGCYNVDNALPDLSKLQSLKPKD